MTFGAVNLKAFSNPNHIKVSLFIPNLHGGGAERVFINLAKIFSERGLAVELVAGNSNGELVNQIENISMVDLRSSSVLKAIIPLVRHLRKSKPDILMSAMPHANLAAIIASLLSGRQCKVVSTVHENVFFALEHISLYEKFILYILKFGYHFSDGFVAVSTGLLKSYERFQGNSLPRIRKCIYNPIIKEFDSSDVTGSSRYPENGVYRIVSAGRLSFEKNFGLLINAFSLIEDKSNITLTIYGEGPEREVLERLIERLDLHNYISLPGYTHDLTRRFSESNLFVMTSIWEGFGNVLVEAMAAGCRVISTDCESGPREILGGGKYGQLVPVNDAIALANAITIEMNQPAQPFNREEMLSPFTFDNIGSQYISLFKEVLEK